MIYRNLPGTSKKISVLGYGTAGIGLSNYLRQGYSSTEVEKESIKALEKAIEGGVNFFDTAPAYANKIEGDIWPTDRQGEKVLGTIISQQNRSSLFISTKTQLGMHKPSQIRESLYKSLELLNTTYVDTFFVHGGDYGEQEYKLFVTDEMVDTLESLKKEGVVKNLGVSGYREGGVLEAMKTGIYDVVMPQYNIFYRGAEWKLLDYAKENNIAVFPMRSATGEKIVELFSSIDPDKILNKNPYHVALEYVLRNKAIISIPVGMRTPNEVAENIEFINSLKNRIYNE